MSTEKYVYSPYGRDEKTHTNSYSISAALYIFPLTCNTPNCGYKARKFCKIPVTKLSKPV